jgi:hypothetical protein
MPPKPSSQVGCVASGNTSHASKPRISPHRSRCLAPSRWQTEEVAVQTLAASDSTIASSMRVQLCSPDPGGAEFPERAIGYRSHMPIMSQSIDTAGFAPVNAVWRSLV